MSIAVPHEDLRDDFLMCRTVGHAWFEGSATKLDSPGRDNWWWVLDCSRCTTKRVDLIDHRTGDVADRKYEYPKGYQIDETVTRSRLRMEWEQRRKNNVRRLRKAAS